MRKILRRLAAPFRWIRLRMKPVAPEARMKLRMEIAARYLTGEGIEIGALHMPLDIPRNLKVRYVDRLPNEELRQHYPELHKYRLVPVDIVDNGEKVPSIPDTSVDFVIANHLIEHAEDPIGSIQHWLRVIRPGGILFLAVPHKLHTFDRDRPVTSLEHLVGDYTNGPESSRRGHFEQWVRLVEKTPAEQVEVRVQQLMSMNYSIHYHVWTEIEFLELLLHCRNQLGLPFSLELFQLNEIEFVAIMRKRV